MGPGLFIVLAALPALRVELSGEPPCELASRLKPALTEQKLTVDDAAAHRLVVATVGDSLVVRLVDRSGRELGWRTLRPSPRDCAVLPRTIVLLARTWLGARFPDAEAGGAEAPLSPRKVEGRGEGERPDAGGAAPLPYEGRGSSAALSPPTPDVPPRPAGDVRAADTRAPDADPPSRSFRDGGLPDAGSFLDAGPPDAGPPDAGLPDAGPPDAGLPDAGLPDAGEAASEPRFAVAALAGVSLDLARPAGHFTAFVDGSFLRSWGLAFDLGADSPRSVTSADGTITLQHYAVGLSLRRSLVSNLHASLGARLFFMPAATSGFTQSGSRLLVSGGFFAALDWRQPIYDRIFVIARIGGQARIRWEVIGVTGSDAFLALPAFSFFAQAGLGLKL